MIKKVTVIRRSVKVHKKSWACYVHPAWRRNVIWVESLTSDIEVNVVIVDYGLLVDIVEGLAGEQAMSSQRQFLNAHCCTVWDDGQVSKCFSKLLDPRPFPQIVHHCFDGVSAGLGEAPYVDVRHAGATLQDHGFAHHPINVSVLVDHLPVWIDLYRWSWDRIHWRACKRVMEKDGGVMCPAGVLLQVWLHCKFQEKLTRFQNKCCQCCLTLFSNPTWKNVLPFQISYFSEMMVMFNCYKANIEEITAQKQRKSNDLIVQVMLEKIWNGMLLKYFFVAFMVKI